MTVGMTTVVLTFYYYTMPILWMGSSRVVFVLYMIYGHYLLVNIIFHYYMGVFTNPGTPPKVSLCVCTVFPSAAICVYMLYVYVSMCMRPVLVYKEILCRFCS